VIKLRRDAAPNTCTTICKLVTDGLYNGCCFYRAEPNFVLQGGLRKPDGSSNKTPYGGIELEYKLPNLRGTVSLARWEKTDSGTGEFFVNLKDSKHLDKTGNQGWALGFCVWGEVEADSLAIADALSLQATTNKGGMKMLNKPIEYTAALVKK